MPLTDVYIPYRDWVKDMIVTEDPVIGEFLYQMFFNPEVIIKMDDYYLYKYSAVHKEPYLAECLKLMSRKDAKARIRRIKKTYNEDDHQSPELNFDVEIYTGKDPTEEAPDKAMTISNTPVVDSGVYPEDCINIKGVGEKFAGIITSSNQKFPNLSIWMGKFMCDQSNAESMKYDIDSYIRNRLVMVLDAGIYSSDFIEENNTQPHIITDWLFPVFYEPGKSNVITLPNPKALDPDPTEMGYHIYVTNSDQHTKSLIGTITYPMKPYNVRYLTLLKQQMDAGYTTIFANDSLTDSIR